MNKKLAAVGTSIAVGSVMLVTTVFAGMTGISGYDAFKNALKNTRQAQNMTAQVQFSVKDNDSVLGYADGIVKVDYGKEAMSSTMSMKVGEEEKTFSTYRQDGKTITKSSDSDIYGVMEFNKNRMSVRNDLKTTYNDEEALKDMEQIIDAVAGNFQNYISGTENADGTKEFLFQMSGNQISPVVNTIASAAFKSAARHSAEKIDSDLPFKSSLQETFPKLVEDIRVESVELKSEISKEAVIEKQIVDISISGKDADGKVHDIVINADIELSDVGKTTPDTVNLEGKQIKNIVVDRMEKHKELRDLK